MELPDFRATRAPPPPPRRDATPAERQRALLALLPQATVVVRVRVDVAGMARILAKIRPISRRASDTLSPSPPRRASLFASSFAAKLAELPRREGSAQVGERARRIRVYAAGKTRSKRSIEASSQTRQLPRLLNVRQVPLSLSLSLPPMPPRSPCDSGRTGRRVPDGSLPITAKRIEGSINRPAEKYTGTANGSR